MASDQRTLFVRDPNPDDDIYINCQPVDEFNVEDEDSLDTSSDQQTDNDTEFIDNIATNHTNIFENNAGFQTLLGIGIFVVILFSGDYVFYKLPKNKLDKAILDDRFR